MIVSPNESGPKAQAVHLLNRIGFGPTPGAVNRVVQQGLSRTLEQQLYPNDIEDGEVDQRLLRFPLIWSTTTDLVAGYNRFGPDPIADELALAKLLRAILSRRQLLEVMVDFWLNHFNIFAVKGFTGFFLPDFEREVIRPHALGRFRDLLGGVAHHPAMLYYLDNYLSSVPRQIDGKIVGGINENYARELMELHTVGVDAGYTQQDVIEVARVLTGWTIEEERFSSFLFKEEFHDPGDKIVLGRRILSGGESEGEQVLDLLAEHPSTARFVSWRLCQRFIADEPPARAVESAAAVFTSTGGDIRRVMETILGLPEFWDASGFASKPKSPLELVVSALRALAVEFTDLAATREALLVMGMPLYRKNPPTGYSNDGRDWMSSASLLNRMNFVFDVLAGDVPGLLPRLDILLADVDRSSALAVAERVAEQIFGYRLSRATWDTASRALPSDLPVSERVIGLMLVSPDFQRR